MAAKTITPRIVGRLTRSLPLTRSNELPIDVASVRSLLEPGSPPLGYNYVHQRRDDNDARDFNQ